MGTNMTLYAELYAAEGMSPRDKRVFDKINSIGLTPKDYPIKILRTPIARWYNDFSILQYFIDGFDAEMGREVFLEKRHVCELLTKCSMALENPSQAADQLLSYNAKYNDDYWEEIKSTQSQLTKALSVPEFEDCDFYFRYS